MQAKVHFKCLKLQLLAVFGDTRGVFFSCYKLLNIGTNDNNWIGDTKDNINVIILVVV
jgi:hypothetical protein